MEKAAIFIPEDKSSERWIALLLLVLTGAYVWIFRHFSTIDPDEGIVLQGADRILRGQVPYRDFFSFVTPGSYYWTALLFKVFGNSINVARAPLVVFSGVFSAGTYLLSRRVCARSHALLVAALVSASCVPYRFAVLHNWDSTLGACLALYCAVRMIESERRAWAFGAGTFASLTFLFEQSKGGGLILGLGLGLGLIALRNRGGGNGAAKFTMKQVTLKQVLPLAAGMLWPLLATMAWFYSQHALTSMLADWLWPLQYYTAANRVPYGYQNWSEVTRRELFASGPLSARVLAAVAVAPLFIIPALPLVSLGLLTYWVISFQERGDEPSRSSYYILVSATIAGLLLSVVMARADSLHFMYLEPLFCVPLAWIFEWKDLPGRLSWSARTTVKGCTTVAFLAMSLALLARSGNAPYQLDTRRGVLRTAVPDTVVEYVQSHLHPGETLLVYPYLPLYYYLTQAGNPLPYDFFQPGINTSEQAREIQESLTARSVEAVLFEPLFTEKIATTWPSTPAEVFASDPVASEIFKHYHVCKILASPMKWRFLYMVRRETPCP